jgi:hypothetical protein
MRRTLKFLVICTALGFLFAAHGFAQQSSPAQESQAAGGVATSAPTPNEHAAHQHGKSHDTAGAKGGHEHMQDHCDQMMAEMKAMDARLTEKVAVMNAAAGNDKIEAMAAVVNELVAQRKTMQEHMMSRHGEMTSPGGDKKGSMKCGMMGHQGKSHDQ